VSIAGRAIRAVPREPEFMVPALVIPVFFYFMNVGALEDFAERGNAVLDFKAFELPVAVVMGVTGMSRANALVLDIQDGYFDRLLLTPVSRLALLLGLMAADFAIVVGLTTPVVLLGFIVGVSFETGVLGVVLFVVMGALWGLAFTGYPYAIALKTGNPSAVNASFVLFFPFAFMTTAFLPQEALTGWLSTIAEYNPVTYLLAGMRSLNTGWELRPILEGFVAIAGIGVVGMTLAMLALRGRVRRG
jgi:ABC-2 type transport system permease protein